MHGLVFPRRRARQLANSSRNAVHLIYALRVPDHREYPITALLHDLRQSARPKLPQPVLHRTDTMKALTGLYNELTEILGYLIHAGVAFNRWKEEIRGLTVDPSNRDSLNRKLFVGGEDPTDPSAKYIYVSTVGDLLASLEKNGIYFVVLRRSALVLAYAAWEDNFRAKIAKECNTVKNDIQSDVFKDLNMFRQAVVHGGGVLRRNPQVLKLFSQGQEVVLSNEHMHDIFAKLIEELNRIGREYYSTSPGFTLNKVLNES